MCRGRGGGRGAGAIVDGAVNSAIAAKERESLAASVKAFHQHHRGGGAVCMQTAVRACAAGVQQHAHAHAARAQSKHIAHLDGDAVGARRRQRPRALAAAGRRQRLLLLQGAQQEACALTEESHW